MARAWIEPPDPGWGPVRAAVGDLERLGYVTAEVRGTGVVFLRLSGSRLDAEALWIMPPGLWAW